MSYEELDLRVPQRQGDERETDCEDDGVACDQGRDAKHSSHYSGMDPSFVRRA